MASVETRIFLWGALCVASSGLLWPAPVLGVLSMVAGIAALVLVISRLGYLRAILISLTALTMSLSINSLTMESGAAMAFSLIYLVIVILPGFAMGSSARRFLSPAKTIWNGLVPVLVLFVVLMAFYAEFTRGLPSVMNTINMEVTRTIQDSSYLSRMIEKEYGSDPAAVDEFVKDLDNLILIFVKFSPGILMGAFLTIITIALVSAGYVGSKLGLMIPRLRPFHLWRAGDWWLLPTAAGLALAIFAGNEFWVYAGLNMLVVTGIIYGVCGLAVVEAAFKRFSIPLIIRLIIYLVLVIIPISLAVTGLLDSRFRFRRESNDRNESQLE
jgi:hypothetical protein